MTETHRCAICDTPVEGMLHFTAKESQRWCVWCATETVSYAGEWFGLGASELPTREEIVEWAGIFQVAEGEESKAEREAAIAFMTRYL